MFANNEDLEKVTGCKTAGARLLILKARKIKHFLNADNKPVVPRSAIEGVASQRSSIVPSNEAIAALQAMPRNGSGIYFLCHGEMVVYVGKTTNFFSRMSAHDGGQNDFDSVKFLSAPVGRLDALEREYIARFCPKYNKAHNRKRQLDEQAE